MKTLIFLFALIPFWSYGQDSLATQSTNMPVSTGVNASSNTLVNAVNYLEKSVWRVEFFGPGIINESRIGRQTTFVSQLRTVGSFVFRSANSISDNYSAYTINPQLSVAIRQFYNFSRRLDQDKSIRYNSGNYVTAKLLYVFPAIIEHNTDRTNVPNISGTTLQAMWGFQRTYRKNFYLNLEVGLGFGNYYSNGVGLASYFTLGYTFPKRH